MNQYEFATIPGALQIPAYEDRAYRMRRPLVSRHEYDQAIAERDAALAEVARLEWAICHLLMRDGSRHGGRVAVPLLALALTDGAA